MLSISSVVACHRHSLPVAQLSLSHMGDGLYILLDYRSTVLLTPFIIISTDVTCSRMRTQLSTNLLKHVILRELPEGRQVRA